MVAAYNNITREEWGDAFIFPSGRARSFPLIFVSEHKHANYRTILGCASGGFLNADTCWDNTFVGRFLVWESHNIGSAHHQLVDCVGSQFDDTGHPGSECFWTGTTFKGWSASSAGATAYNSPLLSMAVQGTRIDATRFWIGSDGY